MEIDYSGNNALVKFTMINNISFDNCDCTYPNISNIPNKSVDNAYNQKQKWFGNFQQIFH